MNPVILFRKSLAEIDEFDVVTKYFTVKQYRSEIEPEDFVICRYSALPYYEELEKDIKNIGAYLVNSQYDHHYVQDLRNWYYDLEQLTPKTWFNVCDIPEDETGPFVLKGSTNSRKQLWHTHMFANNREEVSKVYGRLLDDSLLQHQWLIIRKYVNLIKYDLENIGGCPISKEFRFFVYNNKIIAGGFYWSLFKYELGIEPDANEVPVEFLESIIEKINGPKFYTIDVGQLETGEWVLIELGDAQMAGLSCISADELYGNLRKMF